MGRVTRRAPVTRIDVGSCPSGTPPPAAVTASRIETLAVEEPLEIRVDGLTRTVTMRTPGDDFDLALGWLLSERALSDPTHVAAMMHCRDAGPDGSPTFNVVDVALAPGARLDPNVAPRAGVTSSACGVCGAASIEAVRDGARGDVFDDTTRFDPALVATLPEAMRAEQRVFERTGGLHAAALFSADGRLLCLREDVGRHNAVDKVVGWAARSGSLPLTGTILLVSGRAGFELAQKAVVAGIPALAAVSAPSSLAVELAEATGLTLVGFLRPPRMTAYAGAERLR